MFGGVVADSAAAADEEHRGRAERGHDHRVVACAGDEAADGVAGGGGGGVSSLCVSLPMTVNRISAPISTAAAMPTQRHCCAEERRRVSGSVASAGLTCIGLFRRKKADIRLADRGKPLTHDLRVPYETFMMESG